ncbi:hypothetical protein ACFQ3W_06580 [Paenibacillus puldeungensis]|uniref:HNH endonuclease n=1 Tax=Paenibacillus puldeungensis TaxID=696536 RepID=A0ABW3RUK9_9BACL
MKKCMYCLEERSGLTREHIIPAGLLEMFPEQDVTFNATTDKNIWYKDNKGLVIKDVCPRCNNDILGALDGYGVGLIREYFANRYKDDARLNVQYDYHLLQRWLLKIIYNTLRSSNVKSDWFNEVLQYILYNNQDNLPPVSIFGGIHVDMTAFGEEKALLLSPISSYKPLYVYLQPKILQNGVAFLMRRKIPFDKDILKVRRTECMFTIRFGSAMFLVVLWNKDIFPYKIEEFNNFFEKHYPYKLLTADRTEVVLQRVTDSINCFQPGIIQSNKAMQEADEDIRQVLGGRTVFETQAEWDKNWSDEKQREGRLLIDKLTFPNNKSIEREYNEYFSAKKENNL